MANAKRRHHDIPQNLAVFPPLHASGTYTRSSRFSSEAECISDRQLRKVDVLLCRVDRFTAKVVLHLLGRDACVQRGSAPEHGMLRLEPTLIVNV
jgi:hypothetical protein